MCHERITYATGGSGHPESLPAVDPTDVHVTVLVKGTERYIFVWRTEQQREVLRAIGRHASAPDLNLNWCDAIALWKKITAAVGSST